MNTSLEKKVFWAGLAYMFFLQASCRIFFNGFHISDLRNMQPEIEEELVHWIISSPNPSPLLTVCLRNLPFLGTLDLFKTPGSYVEREYNFLPVHNALSYNIWFLLVGPWLIGDSFKIIISSSTTSQTITFTNSQSPFYANFVPNICWSSYSGLSDVIFMGKMPHSGSSLKIRLESNLLVPSSECYFAFREVSFLFRNASTPVTSLQNYVVSDYFKNYGYPIDGQWPCKTQEYQTISGCSSCHSHCFSCFEGTEADCFTCATGYFFDGTKCISCDPSCEYCSGPTDRDCIGCFSANYYLDHTCVVNCDPPFLVNPSTKYCTYPCKQSEFLYPNQLCYPTCDSRFNTVVVSYKQLCTSPCAVGEIMYYNGTCSTTQCPYPLVMRQYGGFQICEYPCSSAKIVYPDKTCEYFCVFPFVIRTYGEFEACESPCSSSSDFSYYWENSCRNTCPSPLQKRMAYGINICDPPQCGAKLCDLCQTGDVCPEYYYCNATVPSGKFCIPYFDYKLEPKYIRTVTNGVILSANVIPDKGIVSGINDTLLFHIQNLFVGVDYNVRVEKISKGSFLIYVEILRSLNTSSSLVGHFNYGPATLGLKENLQLPRLTYISINTQDSAQKGKLGSQILFFIFLIAIISCVLGGGLSIIWSALPETQYGFYLRYLNIPYLHHTEVYFESLSSYDMLISDEGNTEHLSPELKSSMPSRFFIQDYSPNFIDNGGQVLLQLVIILTVLSFSILLVKYVKFSGRGVLLFKLADLLRKTFKWNGLIRYIMTFALALSTASFVQIYGGIFGQTVYFPSLLLAITSSVGVVSSFYTMFALIAKIPKGRYERTIYSKSFGTLWEELETRSVGKYYYWLITLRGFLLAYLCVFFELFPYVQILALIVYQFGIVVFFIQGCGLRRVFSDKTLNKVTMSQEICFLFEKIAILLFLILNKVVSDNTLILLGWVIVMPAAAMQVIQTLYSFTSQITKRKAVFFVLKQVLFRSNKFKGKKIRRRNLPRVSNETREMIIEDEAL